MFQTGIWLWAFAVPVLSLETAFLTATRASVFAYPSGTGSALCRSADLTPDHRDCARDAVLAITWTTA
jgi:hypothetical protein